MKNFKCDEGHLSLFLNAIFSREKIYDSYRKSIIEFTTECAWEEREENFRRDLRRQEEELSWEEYEFDKKHTLIKEEQISRLQNVLSNRIDEMVLCQDYLEEKGPFQKNK